MASSHLAICFRKFLVDFEFEICINVAGLHLFWFVEGPRLASMSSYVQRLGSTNYSEK